MKVLHKYSVQFSSVTELCPTLCDPMNHSTPGLPVHHQLPEFTQTRPLCRWCHPTISSSVVPFSSCPQSFPTSGSFQMSQFSTSGGQSIGVSASIQVLAIVLKDQSHLFIFNWFYSLILFLAALGLRCCVQASSSCWEQGLLFVEVCGLPTEVVSLVCGARAPQLLHTGAVAWRHVESSRTHWQVREVHVL